MKQTGVTLDLKPNIKSLYVFINKMKNVQNKLKTYHEASLMNGIPEIVRILNRQAKHMIQLLHWIIMKSHGSEDRLYFSITYMREADTAAQLQQQPSMHMQQDGQHCSPQLICLQQQQPK